jgi:transcriptional regulator with XRE-family HTH domain
VAELRPADIGTQVKRAREARGLSIRQIADSTKLSTRLIDALERGHAEQLPAGIYRRAAVRAIAAEVGLDPERAVRDLLVTCPDDLPKPGESAVTAESPPAEPRRFWFRTLAIFAVALPMLGGVAYFATAASRRPSPARGTTPAPPARKEPAGEVSRVGGFHRDLSVSRRAVMVQVSITSRCRLQIVADNKDLVAGAVEAGESLEFALNDDVVFVGDDAGAVQFSINGQAGRPLGSAGQPLSVRIDREHYHEFLASH